MYITYEEYIEMGGTADEKTFKVLEAQARHELDFVTWNRIKLLAEIPTCVKEVMLMIMNLLSTNPQEADKISSYSNGVETFSYGRNKSNSYKAEIANLAVLYLPDKLVYRGHLHVPIKAGDILDDV